MKPLLFFKMKITRLASVDIIKSLSRWMFFFSLWKKLLDRSINLNHIQTRLIFVSWHHGGYGGPPTLKPHMKRPPKLHWKMLTSFLTCRYNLCDTLRDVTSQYWRQNPNFINFFPKTSYKAKSTQTVKVYDKLMKLDDTLVIINNRSDVSSTILDLQFWIN